MARNIWDVSDILLQQRAGDIQGNMFANLGQQAGNAFQQYGERKKQNKAMEGEIGSTIKFLESARDMVKDDPKRSAQIDQTLTQLHDPNVNLIQRYSMAKGAGQNIVTLVNLGESVQKQQLLAAEEARRAKDIEAMRNFFAGGAVNLSALSQAGSPETALRLAEAGKTLTAKGGGQPQEITTPGGTKVIYNAVTGVFSPVPNRNAPSGFEWLKDESGNDILQPVKGGPIDIEMRAKKEAKEESHRQVMSTADNVIDTIDNAMPMVDQLTAGFSGKALSGIPGTRAKNLANLIETIKSNVGFDRLQQMRLASPTGGALGQVAVQELKALQASIASLEQDQSPEQLRDNLLRVRNHYDAWRSAMTEDRSEESTPAEPGKEKKKESDVIEVSY